MGDYKEKVNEAIALLADTTGKLIVASECVAISQQYREQIQQWINNANTTICQTNQLIADMGKQATPSESKDVIISFERHVLSFGAIVQKVLTKLTTEVSSNTATDECAINMNGVRTSTEEDPPPSYAVVMGQVESPTAPSQLDNNTGPQTAQQPQVQSAVTANTTDCEDKRSWAHCKLICICVCLILKFITVWIIINRVRRRNELNESLTKWSEDFFRTAPPFQFDFPLIDNSNFTNFSLDKGT